MKDYYALLGLDSDATDRTIKLAYRRLAKESHPDRVARDTAAFAEATARMAELNEAYAVLSDVARRRAYNEQLRRFQSGEPPPAAPVSTAATAVQTPPSVVSRPRTRASKEVFSTLVAQMAQQMRRRVDGIRGEFRWKEKPLEGFQWSLTGSFWSSQYHVALRAFTNADSAAARKFTNYATAAVKSLASVWKTDFFIFLLPFQRMEDQEVIAICRRFANASRGSLGATRALIVLVDASHGKSVVCGPSLRDQRFQKILQALGARAT